MTKAEILALIVKVLKRIILELSQLIKTIKKEL